MSEHTPGPWRWEETEGQGAPSFLLLGRDGQGIAPLQAIGGRPDDTPDGCLMIAAPDLLAACEAALEDLCGECMKCRPRVGDRECFECCRASLGDKYRAAIAKAKGTPRENHDDKQE